MSAKRLVLILVCLLPACMPAALNDVPQNDLPAYPSETNFSPTATPQLENTISPETRQLIDDYLSLRSVPGQFTGGTWNEDVDRWMGHKHAAMLELGNTFGTGDFSCTQLTELLQTPDHTVQGGDPLHDLIQTLPAYETLQDKATQFLVYEWRGTHDFLFFICEDGRITGSDWWYAGE